MSGSSDSEFKGKRALVTGGTKGMGEAIVQRLRSSGAMVVTTARSAPTALPSPELFVAADLSTVEGAGTVVRHVLDRLELSSPDGLGWDVGDARTVGELARIDTRNGTVLGGERIDYAEHKFGMDSFTARVWTVPA